ncbi:solute carrier organic anion transporter family member 2B1-like [Mytilus edulis]|uniref:solute carrier organic anion transporter family member 2B1-like n=1 Tax=Mytilus edulis TaxID=6550 RepID=UPI0039EF154A
MFLWVDVHSEDLCHTYALEGSHSSTETPQILDQCEDTSDITRVGSPTPYTVVSMAIIASGMILQGIVRSPVEPYLIDYIDTNVKQSSTAAYLGVISSVAILGPAISCGLGGYFSQIHVTLQEVSMSSKDHRWIGAWWLGFIVFGTLSIVSGIPIMFFPNHYKKSIFRNESEKSNQTEMIITTYVKEFSRTIKRLLKNKLYMSINLSGSLDVLSIAGALAFTPKYIETQFGQQRWMSSILTGVLQVIPVSAGILFGGIITSRKKFSPITCIKFLILVSLLDIISNVVNMSLGCPMPDIIGYNIHLNTNSSLCMDQCRCGNNYLPVCAETHNTNYFSPCHAGCTENFQQSYGSCSCLSSHGNMVSSNDLTVKPGLCSPDCQFLIPYTIVSLLFKLLLSCSSIPGFILLIR